MWLMYIGCAVSVGVITGDLPRAVVAHTRYAQIVLRLLEMQHHIIKHLRNPIELQLRAYQVESSNPTSLQNISL